MFDRIRSFFTPTPNYLEVAAGDFFYSLDGLFRRIGAQAEKPTARSKIVLRTFLAPTLEGMAVGLASVADYLKTHNTTERIRLEEARGLRLDYRNSRRAMLREHRLDCLAMQLASSRAEAKRRYEDSVRGPDAPTVQDFDKKSSDA